MFCVYPISGRVGMIPCFVEFKRVQRDFVSPLQLAAQDDKMPEKYLLEMEQYRL